MSVTRFLAFGDSITEGAESPALRDGPTSDAATPYPARLQERLTATYTSQPIVVVNGGRGGERATEGVRRLPDAMREARPQVLLLMEGVNDLIGNAGIAPTIAALESMIKYARSEGVAVLVATLPPQRRGGSRAGAVDVVPAFNDELRKMTFEEDVMLIDVNAAFDLAWIGQDGLHPTAAGYRQLSDIFFAAIRGAFEQKNSGQ